MAKTDAFCTQCGSLIQIDDTRPKNVCIFCKAEVDTKKALELNTDTESRLLLQKAAEQKAKEESLARKEKMGKAPKTDTTAVASKGPKHEIILKPLPMKIKLAVFGVFMALVLLLTAIFVPLILSRNARRSQMDSALAKELGIQTTSTSYKFNDNREYVLATATTLDEGKAVTAFEKYVKIYGEAYGVSEENIRRKIVVTIYDPTGRYVCSDDDGTTVVVFDTATPTHTPVPTQSITN
jgi:hypothetical protein